MYADWEIILNYGDLDVSGGDGTSQGGRAGYSTLWGYNGVENYGDIDVSGGHASAADGTAGNARYAELISDLGPVINTGMITATGGNATVGTGHGGSGHNDSHYIAISGRTVENSGNLYTAGGAGGSDSGGTGGNADSVDIYGFEYTTNTAAVIDANGGVADTPGEDGEIWIGGANATDAF